MRRTSWKTVSTLVTMVVIVGCQDSGVTSPRSGAVAAAPMMMAPGGAPLLSLEGAVAGDVSTDFTVGTSGGTFFIGSNAVVFPSRSICDPAKSDYGPGTWDSPCEPIHAPITVHAVAHTTKTGSWVDFRPALRFVPSSNSRQWVWVYMSTPAARGAKDISKFNILYAPQIGAPGIDESSSDATLRTYVDAWGGLSMRRIKHFSGYVGSTGLACDPTQESGCIAVP